VGSEDGFRDEDTWRARFKPLEVEREIRDDLYLIVFEGEFLVDIDQHM
jgi:hypothetical protein